MKKITIKANANIALIKYWGKRDENLFLPTKSSLSVTLDGLSTYTSISFSTLNFDQIFFNKQILLDKSQEKVFNFLKLFRKIFQIDKYFKIETENNFPTSAGLASSSSGFAALAYGLVNFCDIKISKKEISILARQGSGSASRSIYGGFVLWKKGEQKNGGDSFAEQLFSKSYWPEFCVLVLVLDEKEKKVSSSRGMQTSVLTSPFYQKWIKDSDKNILKIINGIKNKNFSVVGKLAQTDCLMMHKIMQTSNPPLNYWQDSTIKIMKLVKDLNRSGIECYFTIDAGPNVKLLCLKKDLKCLKNFFKTKNIVKKIIFCKVGGGVSRLNL